tara:strand:+ start:372 stop:647 length:276 start_codon:yes stop_codon:yes gene_type:complete
MKQKRLRAAIARVLMDSIERGENGITVGQVADRLMNNGYKDVPSGRRLGQLMRSTRGFERVDRMHFYDSDRGGSVLLSLWSVNETTVREWL